MLGSQLVCRILNFSSRLEKPYCSTAWFRHLSIGADCKQNAPHIGLHIPLVSFFEVQSVLPVFILVLSTCGILVNPLIQIFLH